MALKSSLNGLLFFILGGKKLLKPKIVLFYFFLAFCVQAEEFDYEEFGTWYGVKVGEFVGGSDYAIGARHDLQRSETKALVDGISIRYFSKIDSFHVVVLFHDAEFWERHKSRYSVVYVTDKMSGPKEIIGDGYWDGRYLTFKDIDNVRAIIDALNFANEIAIQNTIKTGINENNLKTEKVVYRLNPKDFQKALSWLIDKVTENRLL